MLLPNKHIQMSESILGLSLFLLTLLEERKSIDVLWKNFREARDMKMFPTHHSFENVLLATSFLFSTQLIDLDSNGFIFKCD